MLFVVLIILIHNHNMYEFNRLWKNMCWYFIIEMGTYSGVICLFYNMSASFKYEKI